MTMSFHEWLSEMRAAGYDFEPNLAAGSSADVEHLGAEAEAARAPELEPLDPALAPEIRAMLTPSLRAKLRERGLSDQDFARSRSTAQVAGASSGGTGPAELSASLRERIAGMGLTEEEFLKYTAAAEEAAS